jgi:hypothetical protein
VVQLIGPEKTALLLTLLRDPGLSGSSPIWPTFFRVARQSPHKRAAHAELTDAILACSHRQTLRRRGDGDPSHGDEGDLIVEGGLRRSHLHCRRDKVANF